MALSSSLTNCKNGVITDDSVTVHTIRQTDAEGFAERHNGSLKKEVLYAYLFYNLSELRQMA
jgi:hypothetical protein